MGKQKNDNQEIERIREIQKNNHKIIESQERVAKIINNVLNNYDKVKTKICVEPNDFTIENKYIKWADILKKGDNNFEMESIRRKGKFYDYLFSLVKSRKEEQGVYYHFMKYEYAKKLIEEGKFQLSSLTHYEANDPFEYDAFLKRYFIYHDINKDGMQRLKDNNFVLCLTDSFRNDYMWDNFCKNGDEIVAIGLRFSEFTKNKTLNSYFQLNDVYYDSGYDFEFLNEIQFYLQKEFNKKLIYFNLFSFSAFY
jgi:hypothetical protein